MDKRINIIRGIHPGKLIERDLKKKRLTQRNLADGTGIPFQTINAVITGNRNLTTEQALKIEGWLGYEESFLAILQTYCNIKQYREKEQSKLYNQSPRVRKSLFWDTDFEKINWIKYKNAVIKRVLERGNKDEIKEISIFYKLSVDELNHYRPQKTLRNNLTNKRV
jgi:addiction module HigA family antidote